VSAGVLNSAIFYAFIMQLTVEERVFILESYLKTTSYAHCRQSFFEKFTRALEEVTERTLRKVARNMVKHVVKCIEMNGHHFRHLL
jgi:7-cyano-7-deazaguanine synthase in queuosine biosynthesis